MEPREERRNHNRYVVDDLCGSMLSQDVTIANISFDGIQIKTTKRLNPGREYKLKIKHKTAAIMIKAEVAWCTLSGSYMMEGGEQTPLYTAGLRFIENIDQKTEALRKFIEESRQKKPDRRLSGARCRLAGEHTAEIEVEYTIKKVSKSGMLVETDEPLDLESSLHTTLMLDSKFIEVQCRVVNCNKNVETGKMLIGLEFLELSEDGKESLHSFIDEIEDV